MKTLFLALAATALMAATQTTIAQSSADVARIKAVVERETTAWASRDATAFVIDKSYS